MFIQELKVTPVFAQKLANFPEGLLRPTRMQTMPNGHRRVGLRPGTPVPSAGQ